MQVKIKRGGHSRDSKRRRWAILDHVQEARSPVDAGHPTQQGQQPSVVASAGETDQDLAAMQFTKNGVAYNNIEF